MIDIPSVYNPESTESKWYDFWESQGLFQPLREPRQPGGEKPKPYCIVIPPPNVTGSLHMGHALNNGLQDLLIRWRRMKGDNTLWVPGTDHGGIATQNVVERMLKKEGFSRHDLGREKFLERMWQWRKESGDTILYQLRKLGCACDWTRTRFTMDEASSKAVLAAFVELYRRHLIYRGRRLVNWCVRCSTALSDIEMEYVESKGKLWHIHYPRKDGSHGLVVATTRPETMLGDTAVAVNPADKRYKGLAGEELVLPLMNRIIPVVADEEVDSAFGTGAVKVTPSHDAADFEIARRHNLPHEMVIGFNGRMTERAGKYAGQTLAECRKNVLSDLEAAGFLIKEEPYVHSVATCYRCATVMEPLESSQWFMKTGDMAKRAAYATSFQRRVRIFPESWEKPYLNWLLNNRDWCLSRQIWWGHQMPVWYCLSCSQFTAEQLESLSKDPGFKLESTKMILRESSGEPVVQEAEPVVCPRCGKEELIRDPDVLDTWFSSSLWPLVTLGWPRKTEDLATFFPTSVLVTGHEILYLWVARMVMMGEELGSEVPFRHVFIHGIVRDKQGRKMSKSLNNVIDPLDIMKKFGTDALRFALASSSVPGRDMQLSDDNFVGARNFANKLWNASRFVITNLEGYRPAVVPLAQRDLSDRWILRRWAETREDVNRFLEEYDIAQAARILYAFFWGDFCDWYIELAKIRLQQGQPETAASAKTVTSPALKAAAQQTLYEVLDGALRALHPIMPFITEELWQTLGKATGQENRGSLMAAEFEPTLPDTDSIPDEELGNMRLLMDTTIAIRTIRSEMNVPPGKEIEVLINTEDGGVSSLSRQILERHADYIRRLAKASTLRFGKKEASASAAAVVADFELFIPLAGLIDFSKEKERLGKEMTALENDLKRLETRLNNPDFVSRAPQEEIDKARARHQEVTAKRERLQNHIRALNI